MSYSEFTTDTLKSRFNLTIQEGVELFPSIEAVEPSHLLRQVLEEYIPLALGIDTEKARSELIVAPILVEVRRLFNHQVGLFSGTDFTVDKTQGLNGRCDFIFSHSPELLSINTPVATFVEAKNDSLKLAIPQCIAEMVAAQLFNEQKSISIPCIYGAVTTGSVWKFLKLTNNCVAVEGKEHYLDNLELILGIISYIIDSTRPNSNP